MGGQKDDEGHSGALGCSATGENVMSWRSPFGDPARLPLQVCFLLPDGRFQAFVALWLELEFGCNEDLDSWEREFTQPCASMHHVDEDAAAELTSAAARPIDCQGHRQRRRCRGLVTPACIRLSPLLLLLRLPLTLLLLFTR